MSSADSSAPLFLPYTGIDVIPHHCLLLVETTVHVLQGKEMELLEFSKVVHEARSKRDIAQSELEIYLSRYNTAVSQLNQGKQALTTTSETLKERKAAIKDIGVKLPQAEQELKEVRPDCCSTFPRVTTQHRSTQTKAPAAL